MEVQSQTESNSPQPTDSELIAACLEGDAAAWEALLRRYRRLIYSIPIKAGLSADDAADVFQTICLRLYEKLSSLRNQEKLSSWLITATRRESWRVSGRGRRETTTIDGPHSEDSTLSAVLPAPGPLADEQMELLQRQQLLRESIEALPERCRELLTLLFYDSDGLSYADIARRLKMPVPSIGPTRARCLEKLRTVLKGRI